MGKRLLSLLGIALVSLMGISVQAEADAQDFLRIGRGAIESVEWSPEGDVVFVSTVTGGWLYTSDLQDLGSIPEAQMAALSPDGRTIAGTLDGQTLQLWDAKTRMPTRALENPAGDVRSLQWSPDSQKLLVTAGRQNDALIEIFDLQAQIDSPNTHGYAKEHRHLMWNAEGSGFTYYDPSTKTLYAGGGQFNFEYEPDEIEWVGSSYLLLTRYNEAYVQTLLDVRTGETKQLCGGNSAAFASTKRIFYAACDGTIYKYKTDSLELIGELHLGWDYIGRMALNPEGTEIALSASKNDGLHQLLILGSDGVFLHAMSLRESGLQALKWAPDGQHLFMVDFDGMLTRFDTETGQEIARQEAHTTSNGVIAWNDDGSLLAVADTRNNVTIRSTATGEVKATLEGHEKPIQEIVWQSGGIYLAIRSRSPQGSSKTDIHIWDVSDLSHPTLLRTQNLDYQADVEWSPDGRQLASTGDRLHVWDVKDGFQHQTILFASMPYFYTTGLRWSPDGKTIVSQYMGNHGAGGLIYTDVVSKQITTQASVGLWTWTHEGRMITMTWPWGMLPVQADPVIHLEGHPDVSLSGLSEMVWYGVLSPKGQYAAAFTSVTDIEGRGLVWETATGDVRFMLDRVAQAVWSPDETRLAIERTNHEIWVLSNTGQVLQRLRQIPIMDPFSRSGTLVWSPDGKQLAYTHTGMIDIWRLED